MKDKLNPAAEIPVPATDQTSEETPNQAPSTTAEQGVGIVDVDVSSSESSQPTEVAPLSAAQNGVSEQDAVAEDWAAESAAEPPADTEPSGPSEAAAEVVAETVTEVPATEIAEATAAAEVGAAAEASAEAGAGVPTDEAVDTVAAPAESEAPIDLTAGLDDLVTAVAPVAVAATRPEAGDSESMTMEDVLAASDEQLARKPVHRGLITTGEVIMLSQEGIIVDVGAKIEGLLPYNQLFEFETTAEEAAKYFKTGDKIQVYVVRSDVPNNTIVLSKKRADQERAWNLLQEIQHQPKLC